MRRLSGLLLFFCAATVWAGAQQYEPLAASVRAALHKAVSDARPAVSSFKSPLEAAALSALLGLDGRITQPAGPVEPVSGSGASVEIASHLQAWIDRLMSDRDGPLQPAA